MGEVQALRVGNTEDGQIHVSETREVRQEFKGPKGSIPQLLKDRFTCLPSTLEHVLSRIISEKAADELIFRPISPKRAQDEEGQ
jgi:hypothetical protein